MEHVPAYHDSNALSCSASLLITGVEGTSPGSHAATSQGANATRCTLQHCRPGFSSLIARPSSQVHYSSLITGASPRFAGAPRTTHHSSLVPSPRYMHHAPLVPRPSSQVHAGELRAAPLPAGDHRHRAHVGAQRHARPLWRPLARILLHHEVGGRAMQVGGG